VVTWSAWPGAASRRCGSAAKWRGGGKTRRRRDAAAKRRGGEETRRRRDAAAKRRGGEETRRRRDAAAERRGGGPTAGHLRCRITGFARLVLELAKRLLLVEVAALHQDTRRLLDARAVLHRLPQKPSVPAHSLLVLEPLHGQNDRVLKVGQANGFDQGSLDVVSGGILDQRRIVICGHQDDRNRPLPINAGGGVDAVHVRHLDVGDHEIGLERPALLDQVATVRGDDDGLVAQALQTRTK
jgi:hypothetical protein